MPLLPLQASHGASPFLLGETAPQPSEMMRRSHSSPARFLAQVLALFLAAGVSLPCRAQEIVPQKSDSARMAWFNQAKFGILLTWGIYSTGKGGASWPMFGGVFSRDEYLAQAQDFTAQNYDPKKWAELFKAAGAKYAVMTAMHCDGVALWPTKAPQSMSTQQLTPHHADLIGPYCDALAEAGLKVGIYYSHVDWTNLDYMTLTQGMSVDEFEKLKAVRFNYQKNWESKNKAGYFAQKKFTPEEAGNWQRFIRRHDEQIDELVNDYKVDLMWFDFMYPNAGDFRWNEKQVVTKLRAEHPQMILNGRIGRNNGDYDTPERGIPVIAPSGSWELCETLNNDWSYVANDHDQKPVRQLLRMLVECVSMGGNLLLGVGPKPDGTIDPEQSSRLLQMGEWIKAHEEAIYATQRGILPGHFYGPTSLSLDGKTLYLYLYDDPKDGIQIKGIKNKTIKSFSIVGAPQEKLSMKYLGGASWADIPPIINILIPHRALDKDITVVKIEFNEPVELFRTKGKDIINN